MCGGFDIFLFIYICMCIIIVSAETGLSVCFFFTSFCCHHVLDGVKISVTAPLDFKKHILC